MNLTRRPGYSWPAAIVILTVGVGAEMLPILGGIGSRMRFDWSFAYVTLHFVLLPLGAAVHLGWNLVALACRRSRALGERLKDGASATISLLYLLLLQLRPLFPLWGDVLWESIKAGR
jgi:hypothetical protein